MAGCTRTLTLNQKASGDMPLTQAVYSATADKIFGTRGGWIHTFNAGTGALESSLRIAPNVRGDTCVGELGGYLYVGTREATRVMDHSANQSVTPYKQGMDIYRIDPVTMAVTPLNMWLLPSTVTAWYWINDGHYFHGWQTIINDGTKLIALWSGQAGGGYGSGRWYTLFRFDPFDIAATIVNRSLNDDSSQMDLAYDSATGNVWYAANEWAGVSYRNVDTSATDYVDTWNAALPCGVAWCPVNNHVYAVQQGPVLLKTNVAKIAANTWDWVNTGVGDATPIHIRYRATDGQLYIPNWQDNTVTVLDPATDTVSAVKAGFSSPIDVVFTPTKAFAVQDSTVGLLEIT
jgi:YVTN family beta-propeller protein